MLVLKWRHGFSLAISGVLFVLQLASCQSGNDSLAPGGSSGASFSAAGAGHTTAGSAGIAGPGSAGATASAGAGGSTPGAAGSLSSAGGTALGDSGGTGGMTPVCTDKQIPDPDHANDPCSIWPEYDAAN